MELSVELFGTSPTLARYDLRSTVRLIVTQANRLMKLYEDMPLQTEVDRGGWTFVPHGSVSEGSKDALIIAANALYDATVAATEEGRKARCAQLAWCHAEAEWLLNHDRPWDNERHDI